ncbi:hypothetical protein HK098_007978 [Nowakowskiella sp. JEL0407]|nr:hypothetical protein HK098_007978 [Nowakowskiella sp. JEL0407]
MLLHINRIFYRNAFDLDFATLHSVKFSHACKRLHSLLLPTGTLVLDSTCKNIYLETPAIFLMELPHLGLKSSHKYQFVNIVGLHEKFTLATNLQCLNLRNIRITKDLLKGLGSYFSNNNSIEKLFVIECADKLGREIKEMKMSDSKELQQFCDGIKNLQRLITFGIQSKRLKDISLAKIYRSLLAFKKLRHLSVYEQLQSKTLTEVLNVLRYLPLHSIQLVRVNFSKNPELLSVVANLPVGKIAFQVMIFYGETFNNFVKLLSQRTDTFELCCGLGADGLEGVSFSNFTFPGQNGPGKLWQMLLSKIT